MSETATVTAYKLPVYIPAQPPEVSIRVHSDQDADRITAVLEALGYRVLRDWQDPIGCGQVKCAAVSLAKRHKLTARELEILGLILEGQSNEQVAAVLSLSRATVKWHMHNIFAKTNTSSRENLLRLALQLPQTATETLPV
jgi:DNA-binding CsgD family transcriptional regulator